MSGEGEASTTVRGVTSTPTKVLAFGGDDVQPKAKQVNVVPGRTYELRTDAQSFDEFDVGVVLSYPLCYVGEGAGTLKPGQGTPFSRVAPVRVTTKERTLIVSVDAACNVWVCVVDDGRQLAGDQAQGSCGCGGGMGPVPKKKCGCARV